MGKFEDPQHESHDLFLAARAVRHRASRRARMHARHSRATPSRPLGGAQRGSGTKSVDCRRTGRPVRGPHPVSWRGSRRMTNLSCGPGCSCRSCRTTRRSRLDGIDKASEIRFGGLLLLSWVPPHHADAPRALQHPSSPGGLDLPGWLRSPPGPSRPSPCGAASGRP